MFSLKNKIAVITGGGSGIGKAISLLFAKQGARVFILDIDDQGVQDTIAGIEKEGGEAIYKKCSVASKDEVGAAIDSIAATGGKIDIIVNNAGIAHIGNAENTSAADFEKLFAVNVRGTYHVIQASIPYLKEHGGVVLNMSSVAAMVGLSDRFAYSMTKGAVTGMTLSLAKDYLQYNIRCNCISPARVHTPFVDGFIAKNYPGQEEEMFRKLSATQPIGRMARPEEIAGLALYLCSDEASFITGCNYPIDGGFTKLNS
ncbi:MAG TPA: SDR family oxidoreductase [Chitinophagaceae bacterium]|nr:SDR family oxidoreductase [Chitinophagaceae bacterium]